MQRRTNTILLIHGLWLSPRMWEPFRARYESRGYKVIAPPWPHMDGDVREIRDNPNRYAGLGLREITDEYVSLIQCLDEEPILVGHSMGGLVVQMLLGRGRGVAGVAIDSATPKGVWGLPWSVIRSSGAILANPLNYWRTIMPSFEQFRYAFAHVMTEADASAAYREYVVPGPGRPIFEVAFSNFNRWAPNRVHWQSSGRAPLLLVAGSEDHLVPPALTLQNYALYRSVGALTAFKEFPGRSHFIPAQTGWEEVADYCLEWAESASASSDRPRTAFSKIGQI